MTTINRGHLIHMCFPVNITIKIFICGFYIGSDYCMKDIQLEKPFLSPLVLVINSDFTWATKDTKPDFIFIGLILKTKSEERPIIIIH